MNVTTINTGVKKDTVEEKPRYSPIAAEEKKPVFTETITQNHTQPAVATAPILFAEEIQKRTVTPVVYPQAAYNNNAGFSWTTILGLFVGVATLVGLGVMIGLSISRTKSETVVNKPVSQKVKEPVVNVPSTAEDKNAAVDQNANQPLATDNKELVRNAVIKTVEPAPNTIKEDKPQSGPLKPGTNTGNPQTETALPKKSAAAVSIVDIEKQVNISNNGYKIGAFGGISDLQCTLVNDSKFALDAVEVEVQYIQANDKIYKTERLSFKDIAAGTQVTLSAPKSPRGVKVVSRIIKINSKESGLSNTTVKS